MTLDRAALVNRIKVHEGYSPKAYRDTRDVLTVGWGTNIGFVEDESKHAEWLNRDIDAAIAEARRWLGDVWARTTPARQSVVAEMFYQLGASRMALFEKFRAALLRHDYADAALQMRLSRWFDQVPHRASTLVGIMEHG
jgi:GH24 family phage-related lysozyme (muramidase)